MRKLILSLAAAGTALAVATPAAAQYYPQPAQPYGYGAPQYGYGYNAYGAQNLLMRVDAVQRRIVQLQRANVLRGDRAERLRREAWGLQRQIRQTGAYGMGGYAQGALQMRLARLEQRVAQAAARGAYRGYGYNNAYGYNNGYANPYGYGQQGYGNREHREDDRYDGDNGGRYGRDDD